MASLLVVRPLDTADAGLGWLAAGALPAEMILTTWQTLERLKAVAQSQPPYTLGADPDAFGLEPWPGATAPS
jgi:hypothetical protein